MSMKICLVNILSSLSQLSANAIGVSICLRKNKKVIPLNFLVKGLVEDRYCFHTIEILRSLFILILKCSEREDSAF